MATSGPSDPLSRAGVVEVLADLVRIPSVNPSLVPDEGTGETRIAEFTRDWLAARGVDAWIEEAAPGRPNAVARVGDGDGPRLALCAHLDTVGTTGMEIPPFDPKLEGNRLYGRGAYDMKGSAAAILCAAAALHRTGYPGELWVALVADEEHASLGARDFVRRHPTGGCILTEPSEGLLVLGHKGFVWLDLETRGRAAHGSRWDLGVSAVARMGRIISALERFDAETLRARTHPLVGPASLHCALVHGGTGYSTYAPACRLGVERRTLPGETTEQVVDEIRRVVRETGVEAEVRVALDRSPFTCEPDAPIAACVREAARAVTGRAPGDAGVAYWMDAAIFAEAGVPTVNYGPAGAGAHAAVEWVDVDSVVTCARVLVEAARRFCGRPQPSGGA